MYPNSGTVSVSPSSGSGSAKRHPSLRLSDMNGHAEIMFTPSPLSAQSLTPPRKTITMAVADDSPLQRTPISHSRSFPHSRYLPPPFGGVIRPYVDEEPQSAEKAYKTPAKTPKPKELAGRSISSPALLSKNMNIQTLTQLQRKRREPLSPAADRINHVLEVGVGADTEDGKENETEMEKNSETGESAKKKTRSDRYDVTGKENVPPTPNSALRIYRRTHPQRHSPGHAVSQSLSASSSPNKKREHMDIRRLASDSCARSHISSDSVGGGGLGTGEREASGMTMEECARSLVGLAQGIHD